jgi:RNA polymerase sigma factor (sigma-70 family)
MDGKEPAGCRTEAQRFCIENYPWLVSTSEQALNKRGFPGYGEDLAQEITDKSRKIEDGLWNQIANPKGYFYRSIVNASNDFCKKHSRLVEELDDFVSPSSSIEEIEAAILLREISLRLTKEENDLLDLMFECESEIKIAETIGINYGALRKRIERLKKKFRLLCDGKEDRRKPKARASKRVYRKL